MDAQWGSLRLRAPVQGLAGIAARTDLHAETATEEGVW